MESQASLRETFFHILLLPRRRKMLDSKKPYFLITYFRKRTLAEVCELQLS